MCVSLECRASTTLTSRHSGVTHPKKDDSSHQSGRRTVVTAPGVVSSKCSEGCFPGLVAGHDSSGHRKQSKLSRKFPNADLLLPTDTFECHPEASVSGPYRTWGRRARDLRLFFCFLAPKLPVSSDLNKLTANWPLSRELPPRPSGPAVMLPLELFRHRSAWHSDWLRLRGGPAPHRHSPFPMR